MTTPCGLDGANSTPKMAPRGIQEGLGGLQGLPMGPPEAPREPLGRPNGGQEAPGGAQEGAKMTQEGSKEGLEGQKCEKQKC